MKTFKSFIVEELNKTPPKTIDGFTTKKVEGQSISLRNGKAIHDGSTYEHEKFVRPGRKIVISHATEKHWKESHLKNEPNTVFVGVHDTKIHEYAGYGAIEVHHDGKIYSHDNKSGQYLSHKNLGSAINYYVNKISK